MYVCYLSARKEVEDSILNLKAKLLRWLQVTSDPFHFFLSLDFLVSIIIKPIYSLLLGDFRIITNLKQQYDDHLKIKL